MQVYMRCFNIVSFERVRWRSSSSSSNGYIRYHLYVLILYTERPGHTRNVCKSKLKLKKCGKKLLCPIEFVCEALSFFTNKQQLKINIKSNKLILFSLICAAYRHWLHVFFLWLKNSLFGNTQAENIYGHFSTANGSNLHLQSMVQIFVIR